MGDVGEAPTDRARSPHGVAGRHGALNLFATLLRIAKVPQRRQGWPPNQPARTEARDSQTGIFDVVIGRRI